MDPGKEAGNAGTTRNVQSQRKRNRKHKLALKKLDTVRLILELGESTQSASNGDSTKKLRIKDLLQPYKVRENISLFLVNFERVCRKVGFSRETRPRKLLTLLPCKVADVIARLSKDDAKNHDATKTALLKKYRLSTEAFWQCF